ncbi:hypothetical protein OE903_11965 [Bacillus sp. B6(2022)]|nr:hypothetical protein [Bacillus sp. B6(2022)]
MSEFFISDTVVTNEWYQSYCDETGKPYPESLTNLELGGEKTIQLGVWTSRKLSHFVSG